MKRLILSALIILLSGAAFAQTRAELYDRFNKCCDQQDTTAAAALIADWERLYPGDAELYSLRANYHFMNAFEAVVVMTDEEPAPDEKALSFVDSLGVTRYMYSKLAPKENKVNAAKNILAEGITKNPDRLDLRVGKAYLHLKLDENALAAQELQAALERSVLNGNKWTGTLGKPLEADGPGGLEGSVQSFFYDLASSKDLASAGILIDTAVRLYPQNPFYLSDKAALYYFSEDLEEAVKWYVSALEIAPDDMLIASNVAHIYEDLGDKQNAVKYYRIVAASGDEEFAGEADDKIRELTAE